MTQYIYKHSAVKHFRRLGQEWRAKSRELYKSIKGMERARSEGEIDYDYLRLIQHLRIQAELYESLGKELKELASDVLHDRCPIL